MTESHFFDGKWIALEAVHKEMHGVPWHNLEAFYQTCLFPQYEYPVLQPANRPLADSVGYLIRQWYGLASSQDVFYKIAVEALKEKQ